jgi:hypothetical protein
MDLSTAIRTTFKNALVLRLICELRPNSTQFSLSYVLTGYLTPMAAVSVTWYTVPPTVFVHLKRCDCLRSETLHSSYLFRSLLSNNLLFVLDFVIFLFPKSVLYSVL